MISSTKPIKPRKKRTIYRKYEQVKGLVFNEFVDVYDIDKIRKMVTPFYYGEQWPELYKNRGYDKDENKLIPNPEKCIPSFKGITLHYIPSNRRIGYAVEVKYPVDNTGLYNEKGKKHKVADPHYSWDFRRQDPRIDGMLRQFWGAVREEWAWQRRAKIAELEERLETDPSFVEECKDFRGSMKTKATIDVLGHLGKLRSAVDAMISGVTSGSITEGTLKTFVSVINKYGKSKKPITKPIKTYFLPSSSKK